MINKIVVVEKMMVCGKMLIGDSMKKMPIGILDEGVQGLCILENLTKILKMRISYILMM